MATDLGRVKAKTASKYDAFVSAQLKQAETRIRMLDLSAGLLGLTALSLAYVLVMLLCDSKLLLSQQARQLSLFAFLVCSAVYLYFAVLRPLRLRINPYYAARQVEQQLPHAKNSIVNWVDLHEQPLSPTIRGALGKRAAKDLSHIDLDRAISGRRAAWMGGLAGLFAIAFIVSFFLLGPAPFLSLLKRTFNPFETVGVSTRTRLTLLKPEGGNAALTVGRGISFVVDVGGKVPDPKAADAVKLLYRYEEGDPWLERRLLQEASGEWVTSLSAIEVKNGFWYKITGGDAATEEYQVGVRAAAAITDFLATYRFRPYVARADEARRERELKALRGAEVLLHVRTNRTLRETRLEFEGNGRAGVGNPSVAFVRGEVNAAEPNVFLVRFVLTEDGKYRLNFTSTDGEAYRDPVSYPVTAIPDQPPAVELTQPGKDIRLPVDALLNLEGKASDDIGIRSLVLQMRVIGGDKLRGQPYRSEDKLRLADGGYPRDLEYKDFVDLSRVQSEDGQPIPLRGGMELEYWLEASDACDYPHANVVESKHFRVLLMESDKKDLKKDQEKKQADKKKKQHEQKQDEKLQKENQDRQQQRQEQEARNKEEANKSNNADKNGAGEKKQANASEQGNNAENKEEKGKENNGQQGGSKDGSSEANNGDRQNELSKEDQRTEEKIKKALEKKQGGANGKGEDKPDKGNQGSDKGAQQNKPNSGEGAGDKSQDENTDSGNKQNKQAGGDKKNGQPQAGRNSSQGDGKGDSSQPKSGESKKTNDKAESGPKKGEDKAGADSESGKDAEQGKDKPMGRGQESAKEKGQQSKGAEGGKAEGERGNNAPKSKPSDQGNTKPDAGQSPGEKKEQGENKQDAGSGSRDAAAKKIADLARALQSKDAGERAMAKEQLQRIAKEAPDSESRQKASEALEKEGEQAGPSNKRPPKQDSDSASKSSGEEKGGEKGEGSKGADLSNEKGNSKKANPGQKDGQQGKNRPGSSTGEGTQGQPTSGDGTPGNGGDRRTGKGVNSSPSSQPKQPGKPRDHRAAQMQLEDFAKQVDKDILKEAGVSEEAWEQYLEAKRKQLTPREKQRPETLAAPQQANRLPSMGGRTIQPAPSGQGDTPSSDRGKPLPGYRDSFRKFTQQMSK